MAAPFTNATQSSGCTLSTCRRQKSIASNALSVLIQWMGVAIFNWFIQWQTIERDPTYIWLINKWHERWINCSWFYLVSISYFIAMSIFRLYVMIFVVVYSISYSTSTSTLYCQKSILTTWGRRKSWTLTN